MRAIIFAGGQATTIEEGRFAALDGDLILGADGGAALALEQGLVPHLVIGDMDSLRESEQSVLASRGCRFITHPREKDESELELALTYAVEQGAEEILILGALGGRLDHTLANILLLSLPVLKGIVARIVDGDEEAVLVRGGESVTMAGRPGDLVSLLPLGGEVLGVSTTGLAWALAGDTLRFGHTRGVSNEMIASAAQISVGQGHLLVIHSPPPDD